MTTKQRRLPLSAAVTEIRNDPSLLLALTTGTALTAFLATAHACCLGLPVPHTAAALLQICSTGG